MHTNPYLFIFLCIFASLFSIDMILQKITRIRTLMILLVFFSVTTVKAEILTDTVNVFQNDTVLRCHIDSIALDAGPGYVTYLWNTGSTDQIIFVSSTGLYSVTRFDGTNYSSADCYFINARILQSPTTLCYNAEFLLEASPSTYEYLWSNEDSTYYTNIIIRDTNTYSVRITAASQSCWDSITINMFPRMYVDFDQLNEVCKGLKNCNGQIKAEASGGLPPYSYNWFGEFIDPSDSTLALGLCADSSVTYPFEISDQYGCSFDTTIMLKFIAMPDIEIERYPDTIYMTNPMATFKFTNNSDTIQLTDWSWKFGDGQKSDIESPVHYYTNVDDYELFFKYTTDDGCQDSIPMMVPVRELELKVPNVFTPNGDGINDYLEIKKLEYYVANEIVIFNRWGNKVFESSNYHNEWDGGNLSDGVYFYVLKCIGFYSDDEFYGSVTIIGKDK